MNTPFGGYAWAEANRGALRRSERWAETLRGLAALAQGRAQRTLRRLGLGPRPYQALLEELPRPSSALVSAAEQALAEAPPYLVAHSFRTYAFGALLGRRDGRTFDPECLLVASLLHDLGLVHREGAACFARRGAERALGVLLAAGAGRPFAEAVADAITMHLNVAPSGTVEAQLLRRGAGFDVVGDEFASLAPETRTEVLSAWPRQGFGPAIVSHLESEATLHPETRIGFLCHDLGFTRLVRRADRWLVAAPPPLEAVGAG